jgi:hypothetical protein
MVDTLPDNNFGMAGGSQAQINYVLGNSGLNNCVMHSR